MKFMLLTAAAFIAAPALAQTAPMTPPADQTMPAPAPTDPAAPAPMAPMAPPAAAPMAGQMPMATPDAAAAATAGGYQPAMPALRGTPAPGAPVVFQPAPTPTEAFPPPAPMAKYPICKKGQYDGCMQRGGK